MTDEIRKEIGESLKQATAVDHAIQAIFKPLKVTTRETSLVKTKLQEAQFWVRQEKSRCHAALSMNTNPDLDKL